MFTTAFRLHSSGWTSGGERTWWARNTLRKQTARSLPLEGVQFWARFRLRSTAAVRPGGRALKLQTPQRHRCPPPQQTGSERFLIRSAFWKLLRRNLVHKPRRFL